MAFLNTMAIGALIKVGVQGFEQIKKLNAAFESVDAMTMKLAGGAGALAAGFAGVAAIGAGVTIGVGLLAAKGLQAAGSFEQAQLAFTTMLGSSEEANKFLGELEAFASRTPFEFPELLQSARMMKAFGFQTGEVIPLVSSIGDAVAAMGGGGEEVSRVTRALGQMRAKGKATTEEMNQLLEVGVFGWQNLADFLKVDVPTAMDMVTKKAVSAEQITAAFMAHSAASFGGAMDKQSRSLLGLLSTLKDETNRLLRIAFTPFLESMKPALALFGGLLHAIGDGFTDAAAPASDMQARLDRVNEIVTTATPAFKALGTGLRAGFTAINSILERSVGLMEGLTAAFPEGMARQLGIGLVAVTAAIVALTPVAAALAVVFGLVAAAAAAVATVGWIPFAIAGGVVLQLLLMMVPIATGLGVAFASFRNEGESVADTFNRLWGLVKAFVSGAVQPLMDNWERLRAAFEPSTQRMLEAWQTFIGTFSTGLQTNEETTRSWGEVVGNALVKVAEASAFMADLNSRAMLAVAKAFALPKKLGMEMAERISFGFKVLKRDAEIITGAFEQVSISVGMALTKAKLIVEDIGTGIKSFILNLGIVQAGMRAWEQLTGAVSSAWLSFRSTVSDLFERFRSGAVSTMEVVATTIADAFQQAKTFVFANFIDPIVRAFHFLVDQINIAMGLVGDTVTQVGTPIRAMFNSLVTEVTGVLTGILGNVMAVLQKLLDTPIGRKLVGIGFDVGSTVSALQGAITGIRAAPATIAAEEHSKLAASALKQDARMRAAATSPEVAADVKLEDKRKICIENNLSVDGKQMAIATKEAEVELTERAGFSISPWQRRQVMESGATLLSPA